MASPHEVEPSSTNSEISPERLARIDVITLGCSLIDLVEERGTFGFDGDWVAEPLVNDPEGARGAVFSRDRSAYSEIDRAEIRDKGDELHVRWTVVRPNANTRATETYDSDVSHDVDSHIGRQRLSDVVPDEIVFAKTIFDLDEQLMDLDRRVKLPPAQPRQGVWSRIFGRVHSS